MSMDRRGTLLCVGQTPEGRTVWRGVFSFYETHGLPLGDLLFLLWEQGGLADWNQLVEDMTAAGRPRQRSIEAVCAAVSDVGYPADFKTNIVATLQKSTEPRKENP